MAYTFADQQAKLSRLLGDSNTGTEDQFPLADRKKELNRGELSFAKDALYLTEYATGVVAGNELALPDDWMETFAFIVNNSVIKDDREVAIGDWERFYNYTGSPPYYYYWRFSGTRKIKLIGTVNGLTYNLFYFRRPTTELSDDADVSIHDEEYREASAYYAAHALLEQIGKTQMSDRYYSKYLKLVRDAQQLAEKHILRKNYPHPDTGQLVGSETDRQGGGA